MKNLTEFSIRLAQDSDRLTSLLHKGDNLEKTTRLHLDLSDPHNCGQTTYFVEFSSHLKILYKPKNLDTEQAY